MILTGKYLCVASLEDIRLQNRALLDGPVFPVRVNGASVLKRKSSRAVTVQSPGVPKQRSVGMEKSGWGSLVVCAVVVKVPTQSSHLKLWNCCANSFLTLFAHCGRSLTDTLFPRSQVTTRPRSATWELVEVWISPRLPRSDPAVAGRSFCVDGAVSPV